MIGKVLIKFRELYCNTVNLLNFKYHGLSVGKNSNINGVLKICGHNSVKLGDNVTINSGENYNCIGGDTRSVFNAFSGYINIGNNVGISNSTIVSQGAGIDIEDDVMIGGGVKIYDTDFHSLYYEDRMARPEVGAKYKSVKIKRGAFIGGHSIILKGVTIGEYSVVGAGSVVTHNIPDKQVWAGNPAKFIKNIEK